MTTLADIRREFPLLKRTVRSKPLTYLDNAATTLAPRAVQERVQSYFSSCTANIHRGVHYLSAEATRQFEATRRKVQKFINAADPAEIIFTSGTTQSINLAAQSFGQQFLQAGDEVIITEMEHHSNIVPWQLVCAARGCKLKYIPLTANGELDLSKLPSLFTPRTKLLAVVYVSNALGTLNPLPEIIAQAHTHDVRVLVDAAQAVSHLPIDVQQLDCDFLAFSGHKMFAPTGVGVLYGKKELLDAMPPPYTGGGMISKVTMAKSTFLPSPERFEAGTPNIAGVLGLDTAIDFLTGLDRQELQHREDELLLNATTALQAIKGLRIIGTAKQRIGVVSFVVANVHPHDLGTLLDHEGIAIRTGHHCTQPLMAYFKIPATARASFAFYNTQQEVERLVAAVHKAIRFFT